MEKRSELTIKNRDERKTSTSGSEDSNTTRVGDISGGKGFAIGTNARSIFIEIGTLFDLEALLDRARRHWLFLTINLALQATAILLWRQYSDRFLIPVWVLLVGMLLLELSYLNIYLLVVRPQQRRVFSLLGIASLLALTGLTGFEYKQAVHPIPLEIQDFGVAVAQFGEGPEFENTPRAREISQLVLERLEQQAAENPDLRFVQFRAIGLVRTEEEARQEGQRIRADLVIWGRLQISEEATTLHFAVLETPDKVSNPMFPRVIPFMENSANGILNIPGHDSKEIANGTTTLAAFTFGLAHYFNWDFAPSARAFRQALATSPSGSDTYLYLIHLYYGLSLQWPGQLESANEQFGFATEILPQDPAALLAMAFGNRSLGNLEESRKQATDASAFITQYIKLHPEDALAYYNRALAHEILQDWTFALSDYQHAVKNEPSLYIARIGVIRMNLVLSRTVQAIQAAQDAIDLAEANGANAAWAYLYLAQSYERENDIAQAERAYQKAISLAPQVDWFRFKAGEFYTTSGRLENAEQEYQEMIDVSSNKVWAYSLLADFYANHGRQEEAIGAYRSALQIDPGVGGLWVALADVYEQLGKLEEVHKAYRRAVEVEPDNLYARSKYGFFLYLQGDVESAILQWEAAHQIAPQQCDILLNLGLAHENRGTREQARKFYTEILALEREADPDCLSEAERRLNAFAN